MFMFFSNCSPVVILHMIEFMHYYYYDIIIIIINKYSITTQGVVGNDTGYGEKFDICFDISLITCKTSNAINIA